MVDQVSGRAADSGQALVSDQAAARLAPSGFDPSRVSNAAFLAWAKQQPAEQEYNYVDNDGCAFAQFLIAAGVTDRPSVTPSFWRDSGDEIHKVDEAANWATERRPWTFGALAERLQQAA